LILPAVSPEKESAAKKEGKMNLIVIAMEGVSHTMFWQYREAMPALWNLYNDSAMFRRFHVSSTSALSSFCDFAFGDSAMLDHNREYPSAPGCLAAGGGNLFEILREQGYETLGVMRASPVPGYARASFFGAWPEGDRAFGCHEGDESFHAETEAFLESRAASAKPFALYFSDRAARLDDAHPEKLAADTFHERVRSGFSLLDRSAKRLVGKLAELNLLSNSVVIGFGPYGNDLWKHGIFKGRVHALPPYADLAWTPLFLHRNGAEAGIVDHFASMIDLKPTILRLLFPNRPQPEPRNFAGGVNALTSGRQVAFTQNLFALERENAGPAAGLAKSYSIADGDFRLIVSSDAGISGEGGMELYHDIRDPGNTRNFLDFFNLAPDGAATAPGRQNIVHPHFAMPFGESQATSVVNAYNSLRRRLFTYIKSKEELALKGNGGQAADTLFPENAFRRKRVADNGEGANFSRPEEA
jgi:arylsulfatase A-like enzyme